MEDVRTGGPDLPATVGMYRPALARILTEAAAAAGAKLRYGTTVESLTHDADGVDVTFSDGYERAATTWSSARTESAPRSGRCSGSSWRAGRPAWASGEYSRPGPTSVTRTDLYYRGPCYIAGYCPTGDDSLYAYLVEGAQDRAHLTPGQRLEIMRDLASHYHGPWDDIRAVMTDPARINYTWFEIPPAPAAVEPRPGRAHRRRRAHLPAHHRPGRGQALEDAAVLADVLLAADDLDQAAFGRASPPAATTAPRPSSRRPSSSASGMLDGVEGNVPALMGKVMGLVSQPA